MITFAYFVYCAIFTCTPTYKPIETWVDNLSLQSHISENSITAPIIWTPIGGFEGFFMSTAKGRSISAFEGIDYALPPTGYRRFRKPIPSNPWKGLRRFVKPGANCLQLDIFNLAMIHGSEDCLYLNLYLPTENLRQGNLLPVILFIHGGGNLSGTGASYGPAYLLERDVVLVTINYRVGILGFLSTGDDASPGNNALKDQLLALKWVAANIQNFGGDPKRITVMGQSASSGSVGLLVLSPRSSHLIHGAIYHSGSPLCHWAVHNQTFYTSKLIAESFGCPTSDSHAMVNCLREQQAQLLVGRQLIFWKVFAVTHLPLGPVIEHPSDESFLEEAPEVSYAKGKVRSIPLLAGVVNDEGSLFAAGLYIFPGLIKHIGLQWKKLFPFVFVYDYDERAKNPDQVSLKIQEFYFHDRPWSVNNLKNITRANGDRTIVQGTYYGIQHHAQVAPTYAFYFNFKGKYSAVQSLGLSPDEWGVAHLDDLIYLFNGTSLYHGLQKSDKEENAISDFMTSLWVNFAATGKPLFTDAYDTVFDIWKPVTDPLNVQVLEINNVAKMVPFPFTDRVAFWSNLNLKDDHPL